ncbi:MAG: hypothetical protein NTY19_35315, partial [Planctomycetota bacterium]|nr:hypothetical protein [Planctomycetota bacterium]
ANVVKLHRFSGKVSYLACPDFDAVPHPAIQRTVKLSLRSRELDCRDHSGKEDPLVLDRKELLVGPDYPGHEKFTRFTEQEESHGLLDGLTDLWTQRQWELQFEQAGLQLRGYRLLWKPGHKRRRRPEVGHVSNVAGTLETCLSGNATDLAMADEVPTPAAKNDQSSPERDGPDSAPELILPQRSRQFGVGKEIGGAVYVHRQYENRLGPIVAWAKRWLPEDSAYDVVKYNRRTQAVSFICCPGFDVEPEPNVEGVVIIRADGTAQRRPVPLDPYIYHHKWLFVDDDYTGFDVQESQRRSAAWLALANVDKSRIGRRSYWQTHVVPLLVGCPCSSRSVTSG